jgi:hypothetical protein
MCSKVMPPCTTWNTLGTRQIPAMIRALHLASGCWATGFEYLLLYVWKQRTDRIKRRGSRRRNSHRHSRQLQYHFMFRIRHSLVFTQVTQSRLTHRSSGVTGIEDASKLLQLRILRIDDIHSVRPDTRDKGVTRIPTRWGIFSPLRCFLLIVGPGQMPIVSRFTRPPRVASSDTENSGTNYSSGYLGSIRSPSLRQFAACGLKKVHLSSVGWVDGGMVHRPEDMGMGASAEGQWDAAEAGRER